MTSNTQAAEGEDDVFVKALERSSIAKTLQAARASLAKPSRPYTPADRSLFAYQDAGTSRPSSGYTVDQLRFVKDTFAGTRSSLRSGGGDRPATIKEEGAEILILDDDSNVHGDYNNHRPSPDADSAFEDSSDDENNERLTHVEAQPQPAVAQRSPRTAVPKPSGSTGGYASSAASKPPLPPGAADTAEARDWDMQFEAVVARLQGLADSEQRLKADPALLSTMADKIYDLVQDLKSGKSAKGDVQSEKLLRAVLAMMDLKETKCIFRLARSSFELLRMDGAVRSVSASGVQAAYLNISKVLFKLSKKEVHDQEFLNEKLIDPLLEVLCWQDDPSRPDASDDLRVFAVGVIKNISHSDENQKYLAQQGAIKVLIDNAKRGDLAGTPREAQVLIQITATLRNLANNPHQHRQFLAFDVLSALTRLAALFPNHLELLVNISRILSKLSLHTAPCEALMKNDAHLRQIVRTMSANADNAPLVLRLAFVLGNLTAKSDKTRIILMFDCEGASLLPSLLSKYWKKDRQLTQLELEKGRDKAAGAAEVEDVLIKLVRLIANVSISISVGTTTASSSAVVDPLLDMLGCKRIGENEELVLNAVAAITNLLFYDAPSNLLFMEENKQLLVRLFRPLLLESYNSEALMETARALGNLSRHEDARLLMRDLRIDEILVILLDHDYRDLVYYICGVLVNLASDSSCTSRLLTRCGLVTKLAKLLDDTPKDDVELQLCAVKVLTNLTLDCNVKWEVTSVEAVRTALTQAMNVCMPCSVPGESKDDEEDESAKEAKASLMDLSKHLLTRLPATSYQCPAPNCGRKFDNEDKLLEHVERRHPEILQETNDDDGD